MRNSDNGEVFGSKVLNLAMIATSVIILMGVLYQPASHAMAPTAKSPSGQIEQVVDRAHQAVPVSG